MTIDDGNRCKLRRDGRSCGVGGVINRPARAVATTIRAIENGDVDLGKPLS